MHNKAPITAHVEGREGGGADVGGLIHPKDQNKTESY